MKNKHMQCPTCHNEYELIHVPMSLKFAPCPHCTKEQVGDDTMAKVGGKSCRACGNPYNQTEGGSATLCRYCVTEEFVQSLSAKQVESVVTQEAPTTVVRLVIAPPTVDEVTLQMAKELLAEVESGEVVAFVVLKKYKGERTSVEVSSCKNVYTTAGHLLEAAIMRLGFQFKGTNET